MEVGALPEDAARTLEMVAPWTIRAAGGGGNNSGGSGAEQREGGYDEHRPRSPPPDLPSLLLDRRGAAGRERGREWEGG